MDDLLKQSWQFVILIVLLHFNSIPHVHALNIGVQGLDTSIILSKDCSITCESEFCTVPPFLSYVKYCGLMCSGCPGEKPCDGLDSCCMHHDACVQSKHSYDSEVLLSGLCKCTAL